jgi:NAD(P)-dependent dehydrogenase (short-subunit alcohol dehydrogenase family)
MNLTPEQKRVVIIFGGDGYVGSATATLFENSGWIVLRASRRTVQDETHITCDIADNASAAAAFQFVKDTFGRIDACVHAASPALERVPFLTASPSSLTAHIQTAVAGTMNIAQCGVVAGVHNIVVITSQATDATKSKMGAYPFAKRVQQELCTTIAHLLPPQTRIHTIAPGILPGGLNDDLPQSVREAFSTASDGSRADATTIALTILDICEQKPNYMTSAAIDGVTGVVTPF